MADTEQLPNECALCLVCGTPVSRGRNIFCSSECSSEAKIEAHALSVQCEVCKACGVIKGSAAIQAYRKTGYWTCSKACGAAQRSKVSRARMLAKRKTTDVPENTPCHVCGKDITIDDTTKIGLLRRSRYVRGVPQTCSRQCSAAAGHAVRFAAIRAFEASCPETTPCGYCGAAIEIKSGTRSKQQRRLRLLFQKKNIFCSTSCSLKHTKRYENPTTRS
jgi:hypothetical protein